MMDEMYAELLKNSSSLRKEADEFGSMDDFIGGGKMKIASMDDLLSFVRIGDNTLVHKAEKDLWRISEDKGGQVVIERLFDPAANQPIRV